MYMCNWVLCIMCVWYCEISPVTCTLVMIHVSEVPQHVLLGTQLPHSMYINAVIICYTKLHSYMLIIEKYKNDWTTGNLHCSPCS